MNGKSSLAEGGAKTICSSISSSKNYYPPAGSQDLLAGIDAISCASTILLTQEIHSEMNSLELPATRFQIPGLLGATRKKQGVEFPAQTGDRDVGSDMGLRLKFNPFLFHLIQSAIKQALFQFEIGDSVTQKTADPVGFFVNDDSMSRAV
jgi:hypothetical protein